MVDELNPAIAGDQQTNMKLMQLLQQQKDRENMIIWQLDPREIIEEIEHFLRGEKLGINKETNKREWMAWGEPLMTESGIKTIITLLRSRLNKVLVLSNLDDEQVMRIALETRLDIIQLLFTMGDEWKIRREFLSSIRAFIDHQVYTLLRRAYQDGERGKIYTAQQYVKQEIIDDRQQEKRGFFGLFKRK